MSHITKGLGDNNYEAWQSMMKSCEAKTCNVCCFKNMCPKNNMRQSIKASRKEL